MEEVEGRKRKAAIAQPALLPRGYCSLPISRRSFFWSVLVAVLLAVLFPLLIVYVDPIAERWGNAVHRREWVIAVVTGTEPLGGPVPYIAALILLAAAAWRYRWGRGWRFAVLVPVVFAVSGLGSYGIKIIVGRPRPFTLVQPAQVYASEWQRHLDRRCQSFPSSDVMVAASFAMLLFLLPERGRARYLLFALPVLTAAGRITNARHYPSDCLAAFILGVAVTWLLWRLQERWWPARAARTAAPPPSPAGP